MLRLKNIKKLIVIIILGFFGGCIATQEGSGVRSVYWFKCHLDVIESQLDSLNGALQEYKKMHGRFPTNDEGLGVLDEYDARFTIDYYPDPELNDDNIVAFNKNLNFFWWQSIKKNIGRYRLEYGLPKNAEEFIELPLFPGTEFYPDLNEDKESVKIEIAIWKDNNLFLLYDGGVLSPWLIPYIYENRNGFDEVVFADSPVNRDKRGEYSVCIDEGIYVYSVGGEFYARDREGKLVTAYLPQIVGLGLVLCALVCLVRMVWLYWKSILLGIIALIGGIGSGVVVGGMNHVTCYIMMPLFSKRDPEMVVQQKELLSKYHGDGVLSDETYEKSLYALEQGLAGESTNEEKAE